MTQDEINRYLALPEKFRTGSMHVEHAVALAAPLDSFTAERLAIASMLVGLRKAEHHLTLWENDSGEVCCDIVNPVMQFNGGEDGDFHALLSACESVAKSEEQYEQEGGE